jgi:peptidyl-prolyl cis-trans isomerase SurA
MTFRPILAALALTLCPLALPAPAQDSPFTAAITVNNKAVTHYEIDQRALFLEVLRTPGDLRERAIEALVDDRLRLDAAERFGIEVSDEELAAGLAEFAARAQLDTDTFVAAIGQDGVAPETFREFVRTGIAWRKLVQRRFGPRITITDAEIDRALTLAQGGSGASVLLSEIVLPLPPQLAEENRQLIDDLARTLEGFEDFAAAARRYSVAPTAPNGGRLQWLPIANLPPQIVPILLTLRPGEITDPVPLPNAIAIFQMRDLREDAVARPRTLAVEYLSVLFPGGRGAGAEAATADLAGKLDSCDDFYGHAGDYPPGLVERVSLQAGDVPSDIALELAKLDPNEVSTALTRGENGEYLVFLMLCGRTTELPEGGRAEVREALFGQRLTSYADSFLESLRADAIILEK